MSGGYLTPIEELEAEEPPWQVPWHARLLPYALVAGMSAAWLWFEVMRIGSDRIAMIDWAVSGAVLQAGRFETVLLHMFAHAGPTHLFMNMSVLATIGGMLITRMGPPPLAWLRFALLYLLSGLAGVALYMAIHPHGTVPMVGASGAIYGLVGVLLRMDSDGLYLIPLERRFIGRFTWGFVKENALLFVLLTVPALLLGRGGGVAWEAHLGGFALGLLAAPRFLSVRRYEDI